MFTVAKISHIRSTLGFEKEAFSIGRLESPKANNNKRVCNISNIKQPIESERSWGGNWTNHIATNCISVRSIKPFENLIGTITSVYPGESYPLVNPENRVMSGVPRNCKVVSKQTALPELFNLRFIESHYNSETPSNH